MKIKAKKGYNVVVNDLNLSLNCDNDWIDIPDEDYEKSLDVKKLSKFILINKDKNKEVPVKEVKSREEKSVFVSEGRYYEMPKDVFVKVEEEDKVEIKETKVEKDDSEEVKEVIEETTTPEKTLDTKQPEESEGIVSIKIDNKNTKESKVGKTKNKKK